MYLKNCFCFQCFEDFRGHFILKISTTSFGFMGKLKSRVEHVWALQNFRSQGTTTFSNQIFGCCSALFQLKFSEPNFSCSALLTPKILNWSLISVPVKGTTIYLFDVVPFCFVLQCPYVHLSAKVYHCSALRKRFLVVPQIINYSSALFCSALCQYS